MLGAWVIDAHPVMMANVILAKMKLMVFMGLWISDFGSYRVGFFSGKLPIMSGQEGNAYKTLGQWLSPPLNRDIAAPLKR